MIPGFTQRAQWHRLLSWVRWRAAGWGGGRTEMIWAESNQEFPFGLIKFPSLSGL